MNILKKFAAMAVSAVLLLGCTTFAEENAAPPAPETNNTLAYSGIYMEDDGLDAPDTSKAGAALLMDMNSGRLIYGKDTDARMFPASTTKMMTGILALESGKMGDTVTATFEALQSITLEDSHMGMLIGETLTMTDLLNGMLIYSANDAANVIAVHIGGSMQGFVDMMNAKAQELGMTGTHFANPCGVQDENHYTTAADLAILARYCMQNEQFREIVKTPYYHIAPTNKYGVDRHLTTTNNFLSTVRSPNHLFKACTGIKTGTTEAAGHCLVSSAEYNGMSLLAVVLKCPDENVTDKAYSYTISRSLFDFGFNNYKSGILASPGNIVYDSKVDEAKDKKHVTLTVDKEINALIPVGNDISDSVQSVVDVPELKAPIKKGDVLGTISYVYKNAEIGSANLIAANDVELNMPLHILNTAIKIIINPLVFIPVIIIIILIIIARQRKRRRERKRRLQQLRQKRETDRVNTNAPDRRVRSSEMNRTSSKGANARYSDERRR